MVDLHNYTKRYDNAKKRLLNSSMSKRNKDAIIKFQEHLSLLGIGRPRIIKYFDKMTLKPLKRKN